jgi:hypothetical protein
MGMNLQDIIFVYHKFVVYGFGGKLSFGHVPQIYLWVGPKIHE